MMRQHRTTPKTALSYDQMGAVRALDLPEPKRMKCGGPGEARLSFYTFAFMGHLEHSFQGSMFCLNCRQRAKMAEGYTIDTRKCSKCKYPEGYWQPALYKTRAEYFFSQCFP